MATLNLPNPSTPEVVWGAENIAPFLGKTTEETFRVLATGQVPGAIQIGRWWAFRPSVFLAAFGGA